MLIHTGHHAAFRLLGFLQQVVFRLVQRLAVTAEARKMALHHEGHQAQRSSANVNRAALRRPRTIGVLVRDEIFETSLDRTVRGFGQLRSTHLFGFIPVRHDLLCMKAARIQACKCRKNQTQLLCQIIKDYRFHFEGLLDSWGSLIIRIALSAKRSPDSLLRK